MTERRLLSSSRSKLPTTSAEQLSPQREWTVLTATGLRIAAAWRLRTDLPDLERIELSPDADLRSTTQRHPAIDDLLQQLRQRHQAGLQRQSDPQHLQAWVHRVLRASTAGLSAQTSTGRFGQQVRRVLATSVPCGRVVSYGTLATAAGSPGAARAVGTVMRQNLWPLLIPCHRVVAASGQLGGFQGNCGGSAERKRALLEAEGVTFVDADRIAPACLMALDEVVSRM